MIMKRLIIVDSIAQLLPEGGLLSGHLNRSVLLHWPFFMTSQRVWQATEFNECYHLIFSLSDCKLNTCNALREIS